MKVVILCGGKGIRIRDLAGELPKPMIPIGGVPIVVHIMRIFSRYHHDDFVLCLGHKGWRFKEYFLNFRYETEDITVDLGDGGSVEVHDHQASPPWRVTLANTGEESMTGYRILKSRRYVGEEPFLLTYGDGVADIDIDALLAFHRAHGKLVTVTSVRPPSRFGELVVEGNEVRAFQEKPQTSAGLINGGFFVCEPGVFEYLEEDERCTFEREPLQRLAAGGQLRTYVHDGFWMPMDTTREYLALNRLLKQGEAPWLEEGGSGGLR